MDSGDGAACDSVRQPFSGIGALTRKTTTSDHRECTVEDAESAPRVEVVEGLRTSSSMEYWSINWINPTERTESRHEQGIRDHRGSGDRGYAGQSKPNFAMPVSWPVRRKMSSTKTANDERTPCPGWKSSPPRWQNLAEPQSVSASGRLWFSQQWRRRRASRLGR